MSVVATVLDPGVTSLAEGVLPWFNRKGAEAQESMRIAATLVAIGFMIFTAVKSRGAMSAILVSGLVAGIFLFLVWNITAVRDKVGDEVGTAAVATTVHLVGQATADAVPPWLPGWPS
ncbi:hypothetical protein [Nocardia sp. IFM 10818]